MDWVSVVGFTPGVTAGILSSTKDSWIQKSDLRLGRALTSVAHFKYDVRQSKLTPHECWPYPKSFGSPDCQHDTVPPTRGSDVGG